MLFLTALLSFAAGALLAGLAVVALYARRVRESARAASEAEALLGAERARNENLKTEFRAVAFETLEKANEQFLNAALKDLRQAKTEADETLHLKSTEIHASFRDIKGRLESYQDRLQHFEEERAAVYAKLESSLRSVVEAEQAVRSETASLKRALTSSSSVRGSWGQKVLTEILEKNDLVLGVNYHTQVSLPGLESADLRPDFVIDLPGGKRIVVDAKEVTSEYLLAQESDDPDSQKAHIEKLVQNIRANINRLSRKEYHELVEEAIPYVVMFISNEPAVRAAFSTDPDLFEEARKQRVLIASPMTVIPLINLASSAWQQAELAQNARQLGRVVQELGDRLCKFVDHLKSLQDGLEACADSWNRAVGSWERRVLPQIERVKELGGQIKKPESLEQVRGEVREPPAAAIPDLQESTQP